MGQQQAREYMSEYWKARDKPAPSSRKQEERLRKLFNYYDTDKAGFLNKTNAKIYLNDLLQVSDVRSRVLRDAVGSGKSQEQYYEDFLDAMFTALDRNHNEKLELDELLKPDNDFLPFIDTVSQNIRRSPARSNLIRSGNLAQQPETTPAPTPTPTPTAPAVAAPKVTTPAPVVTAPPPVVTPVPKPAPVALNTGSRPSTPVVAAPKNTPPPERKTDSPSQTPCKGGCSFFGHPANDGYCSQCFKALKEKEKAAKEAKEAKEKEQREKEARDRAKQEKPVPTITRQTDDDDDDDADDDGQEDGEDGDDGDYYDESNFDWKQSGNWLLDDAPDHEEKLFSIITKPDIEQMQDQVLESVTPQLGLSKCDAALLMPLFDWNPDKLLARYFDNSADFLQRAGVCANPPKAEPVDPEKKVECLVCFDSVPAKQTYALACGHKFYCLECWRNYLSERATAGMQTLNTRCIQRGCPVVLHRDDWTKLAAPKDMDRFRVFYMKSFVDTNPKLAYCPNPKCTNAVRFSGFGRPMAVVECTCGARYCFACGLENHNPVTCEMVVRWRERNQSDQESLKLIKATSKQCPHCGLPTERNEGCNHMTCRKEVGGCSKEWCWMCRGDWKSHGSHTGGFYSCNKYDSSEAKKLDDEAGKVKAEAERFQHFWDRFAGHEQNKKDAEGSREKIIAKTVEFRNLHGGDPRFLLEALDLLIQCRHMLKWTYVYAYFIESGKIKISMKDLFEYQQANAEGITERLADALFTPAESLKADELKNLVRVTQRYMDNLTKAFEEMENEDAGVAAATPGAPGNKPTPPGKTTVKGTLFGRSLKAKAGVRKPTAQARGKK